MAKGDTYAEWKKWADRDRISKHNPEAIAKAAKEARDLMRKERKS